MRLPGDVNRVQGCQAGAAASSSERVGRRERRGGGLWLSTFPWLSDSFHSPPRTPLRALKVVECQADVAGLSLKRVGRRERRGGGLWLLDSLALPGSSVSVPRTPLTALIHDAGQPSAAASSSKRVRRQDQHKRVPTYLRRILTLAPVLMRTTSSKALDKPIAQERRSRERKATDLYEVRSPSS